MKHNKTLNKKALYESIMKDISKIVKKQLNESAYDNTEEILENEVFDDLVTILTYNSASTYYDQALENIHENIFKNINLIRSTDDNIIGKVFKNVIINAFDSWKDEHPSAAYLYENPQINNGLKFTVNTKYGEITVKLEADAEDGIPHEYAYIYDKNGNKLTEYPLFGADSDIFDTDIISDLIYKEITPEMKKELATLIERVLSGEWDDEAGFGKLLVNVD